MATVSEYCQPRVVTATPDDELTDAARKLRWAALDCVVVVATPNRRIPVATLTSHQIMLGLLGQIDGCPRSVHVEDVMWSCPSPAHEDDRLSVTLCRMGEDGVRHLPVVDRGGALVGLLSFDDLVEYMLAEQTELSTIFEHFERSSRDDQRLLPRQVGQRPAQGCDEFRRERYGPAFTSPCGPGKRRPLR